MDLKNLMEHHEELITHLQNCNYPKYHTAFFRYGINRICMLNKERCWGSYGDICLELSQLPYPMECLDAMHTVIKVLEQFDLHGLLPDRKYDQLHFKKGAYHHLLPEFRTLVDFYCSSAAASRHPRSIPSPMQAHHSFCTSKKQAAAVWRGSGKSRCSLFFSPVRGNQ